MYDDPTRHCDTCSNVRMLASPHVYSATVAANSFLLKSVFYSSAVLYVVLCSYIVTYVNTEYRTV